MGKIVLSMGKYVHFVKNCVNFTEGLYILCECLYTLWKSLYVLWKNMYILWKSLYIRGEVYIYFIVKSIHTMGKFVPLYGISTPFKGKFICFGENLYCIRSMYILCNSMYTL